MKKAAYVGIGIFIGFALSLSFGAAAQGVKNLVGKEVQMQVPVILEGAPLSEQAVVINDISYAPVRAVSEAAGLQVDWRDNQVFLTKPKTNEISLDKVNEMIAEQTKIINELQAKVDKLKPYVGTDPKYNGLEIEVSASEKEIAKAKEKINDLNKQKTDLEKATQP